MRKGIPLQEYLLGSKVNPDITLSSISGCVPELEEREAAVYCNYNWAQWLSLDWRERAASIAHYRLHWAIERHVQDAVNSAQKKASRGKRST